VFTGKGVKGGKKECDQNESEEEGYECQKQRFSEELFDDLRPARAHGLSHAHLFGPQSGAGCGKVHEVDTGDQEDEKSHDRKQKNILGIPQRYDRHSIRPRVQIDFGKWLQPELEALYDLGALVFQSDSRHFFCQVSDIDPLLDMDIGHEIVRAPCSAVVAEFVDELE
jgi:hypothetical protein